MKRQSACCAVNVATAVTATIAILMPLGASTAAAETLAVFTKSAGNPIARAVRAGAEQVPARKPGFEVPLPVLPNQAAPEAVPAVPEVEEEPPPEGAP